MVRGCLALHCSSHLHTDMRSNQIVCVRQSRTDARRVCACFSGIALAQHDRRGYQGEDTDPRRSTDGQPPHHPGSSSDNDAHPRSQHRATGGRRVFAGDRSREAGDCTRAREAGRDCGARRAAGTCARRPQSGSERRREDHSPRGSAQVELSGLRRS